MDATKGSSGSAIEIKAEHVLAPLNRTGEFARAVEPLVIVCVVGMSWCWRGVL